MNSKVLRSVFLAFLLLLLLSSRPQAKKASFYPGADFSKRAGVLECREGVTYTSAVFPFGRTADSLSLVLATQVENQDLLFVKMDTRMISELEFSLYLRNEETGFVLSRTWEESLTVKTESETRSPMKSVFQAVLSCPAGSTATIFSHEIADKHATNTGILGPTKILLKKPEKPLNLSGPYTTYAKSAGEGEDRIRFTPGSNYQDQLFNPGKDYGYGVDGVGFYFELSRSDTTGSERLTVRTRLRYQEKDWKEIGDLTDVSVSGTGSFFVRPGLEKLDLGEGILRVDVLDREGKLLTSDSTFFFCSLTETWILTEYDGAIEYLDLLLTPQEKKSFDQSQKGEERRKLWRSFWKERDPIPATSQNERLIEYFRRIQVADARFSTPIMEGWKSDRGRVYILLGPPEEIYLQDGAQRLEKYEIWIYDRTLGFQLILYFVDRGFTGLYWLQNEGDFQQALSRMRGS